MSDKKRKVPKLRFPGFTDAWEQRKLGEVVGVNSGRDYKHLESGDFPVYGTGGYMLSVSEALSYTEDAIGIGRKGTIDKPFILKAPFWTVDTLFYCIPKGENDLEFVFSLFQNITWKKLDESTGVPSLSKQLIDNVRVTIPSEKEQAQLGYIFESINTLISLHQRKLDNVKMLKKSLLQKLFPKDGEKIPELRFPGFTDDWEQRKLGEVGCTFTGLSGKSKDDFGHGNAKYVTYLNVLQNPVGSITQLDNIEIDEKQNAVKQGDVFFTTSSETPDEVGMSSVWKYDIPNIYLNSFTFGYRPNQEFDLDYLAYMLRSDSVRQKIKLLAQGISRFNISKTKMMEISIPIASDKEQTEIGKLFANVEALLSLHQRKLDHLKELKKGLLQQMFV